MDFSRTWDKKRPWLCFTSFGRLTTGMGHNACVFSNFLSGLYYQDRGHEMNEGITI